MEFKILLMKAGFTQEQFATALGTHQQKVSTWVNGSEPRYKYLPKIAELLGVDVETVVRTFIEE